MLNIQKNLSNTFFGILSLPATAMGFALCVQIATLSWILNTKYGFDLDKVGLVWIAGPMAGILGQVIIGVISDKVWFWNGRRRPFILIGGIVAALMIMALPNIDVISKVFGFKSIIGVAIFVALTLDLAINISFNPTRSLIADVTPTGDIRTKGYTWMQTISGFFGVLAYLIGAFISNYFLIYMGAIFVFLASVIPVFFIEEPRQLEEAAIVVSDNNTQVGHKSDWNTFIKLGIAHAFTWLGVQTMFIYTFAYIKENIMGFPTTASLSAAQNNEIGFNIGIAFAILNTVGFVLPALVLEPISKRIGRVRTHTLCIAIMAIGYLLIVLFGKSIYAFYCLMAIIGIGWSAVVSLPFAIMSDAVSQKRMGFFMGLFNLFVVVPQLFASGLGSYLNSFSNKNVIFIACFISLGISAILWLFVKDQKHNDSLKQ